MRDDDGRWRVMTSDELEMREIAERRAEIAAQRRKNTRRIERQDSFSMTAFLGRPVRSRVNVWSDTTPGRSSNAMARSPLRSPRIPAAAQTATNSAREGPDEFSPGLAERRSPRLSEAAQDLSQFLANLTGAFPISREPGRLTRSASDPPRQSRESGSSNAESLGAAERARAPAIDANGDTASSRMPAVWHGWRGEEGSKMSTSGGAASHGRVPLRAIHENNCQWDTENATEEDAAACASDVSRDDLPSVALLRVALRRATRAETAEEKASSENESLKAMLVVVEKEKEAAEKQKKAAEKDKEELVERLNCCVCYERRRSTLLLPCRHLALCGTCAFGLRKCPICRQPVQSSIETIIA